MSLSGQFNETMGPTQDLLHIVVFNLDLFKLIFGSKLCVCEKSEMQLMNH